MRSASWWVALPFAIIAAYASPRDARACGGCFHGETTTVVTDHRMILSIGKDRSTLYDQIAYSGAPASFAWVLPISGTVEVGLSSDAVFQALDGATATRILPPAMACPPAAASCPVEAGARKNGTPEEDVTVTKREVVGPYETVQLKASDANALETWLTQNGFVLPADVKPVVAQYVAEKFDFLALKLLPGQGVKDMRPVRVTTPGANAVLPLRMVAAGTGATVGITLWILGEGRYEPQNFPVFVVGDADLVWDWTQNKSNFVDVRAQKTAAGGGRAWELESSTTQSVSALKSSRAFSIVEDDYLPVVDAQMTVVKSAQQVHDEDLAALFGGAAQVRVTRLRSDLAHAALSTDLVVAASSDQAELASVRQVSREAAEPLCPVYDGCAVVGSAPRSQAAGQSAQAANASSSSSSSCVMGATGASPVGSALAACAVAVAFSIARARRRRAREM